MLSHHSLRKTFSLISFIINRNNPGKRNISKIHKNNFNSNNLESLQNLKFILKTLALINHDTANCVRKFDLFNIKQRQ